MRLLLSLVLLFAIGCSSHTTYIVKHRDGRQWRLDGPPSGYGFNGVLQDGTAGTYTFRGDDGFLIRVNQIDCQVEEIPE